MSYVFGTPATTSAMLTTSSCPWFRPTLPTTRSILSVARARQTIVGPARTTAQALSASLRCTRDTLPRARSTVGLARPLSRERQPDYFE